MLACLWIQTSDTSTVPTCKSSRIWVSISHFQSTWTCSPESQNCLLCSGWEGTMRTALVHSHAVTSHVCAEPWRNPAHESNCSRTLTLRDPAQVCTRVCFHVCASSCVLDTHQYPAWEKIIALVSPHRMETQSCELNRKKAACMGKSIPPASKSNPLLPEGLSQATLTDWAGTELVFKASFKTLVKWIIRGHVTPFFEDSTESCQIEMATMFVINWERKSVITERKPWH